MELIYKNMVLARRTKICFLLLILLMGITNSCKKGNGDSQNGNTELVIELLGISDGADQEASSEIILNKDRAIKASSGNRRLLKNGFELGQLKMSNSNDLNDISGSKIIDYNSDSQEGVFAEQTNHLKASINKKAATTPMGIGIKYRVLFFKGTDTAPFAIVDGSAGVSRNTVDITPGKIAGVNTGTNIRWVAYSYNSSNTLPAYTNTTAPTNKVTMNPEDASMPDLLYSTGSITATLGENRINLTLKRVMAKMRIGINLSGTSRTFEAATASIDAASRLKGNFNLNTGKFENVTNVSSGLTLGVVAISDNKKVISFKDFYTVPTGSNAIYFKLTSFSVKGSSGMIQTSVNPKEYNFDPLNRQPQAGRTLLTELAFTESPLVKFGLEYSRGYVYYDKNLTTYKYNMLESESVVSDYTTSAGLLKYYFRNRKLLPVPEGTNDPDGDPCQQVYPKNFWTTPISLKAPFALGEPNPNPPYPNNNGDLAALTMTGAGGNRYWYLVAKDESQPAADPGLYAYPEVRLLALGYRETHTSTTPSDFKTPNSVPANPAGLYLLGRDIVMQYQILTTGWNGTGYKNWNSLPARNTAQSSQGFPLRCQRNYDFPSPPQAPFNWPN